MSSILRRKLLYHKACSFSLWHMGSDYPRERQYQSRVPVAVKESALFPISLPPQYIEAFSIFLSLLKRKHYIFKNFTFLKCSVVLIPFVFLCNSHHQPSLELLHHPKLKLCTH